MTKNKRSKDKPRDIDICGTKYLLSKGTRKKLNKKHPEVKKKKLSVSDWPKVKELQKS